MSPLLAPTASQIERALDELLREKPEAQVLGMRSPVRCDWPPCIERNGRCFRLAWCASELELREQLDEPGDGLILLTPLDVASLGCDVAARLPGGRLRQVDRWSALRGLFNAREVDPRLRPHRWLADLLLDCVPPSGYRPARGATLDLETVWQALDEYILGFPEGRTDLAAVLRWSLDPALSNRLESLPDEARHALRERLETTGEPGASLVLAAAEAGRGTDALPIGLACGVLFGEAEPRASLREAAVRLEPLVGGTRVDVRAGKALAEAARRVLQGLDSAEASAIQSKAADLLVELRAADAAALSPALALGLDARMAEAASALAAVAVSAPAKDVLRAWERVQYARAHDRAAVHRERIDRLLMAARLATWVTDPGRGAGGGLAVLAQLYAAEGSYVDLARHSLAGGDALESVGAAYADLKQAAAKRRDMENRSFASALREWNASGSQGAVPVPVEKLLATVVGPLARTCPVLLLILDGLSFAVWRALAPSIMNHGWNEWLPAGSDAPWIGAAALPTVTEISRASLLCGKLTRGDQASERAGFAAHPGLLSVSAGARPPRLFHKGDLGSGSEPAVAVLDAILDGRQKVVGVVHNAVDADLSGSDQIAHYWSAETLRHLLPLMRAAQDAGRAVVVTGDHGHVVEEGTCYSPGGAGSRWRDTGVPEEGEAVLSGGRLLSRAGNNTIVALWSEGKRYSTVKGGYHGGVTPQEVLVPVAVLGAGKPPTGWDEAPPSEPAWWRGPDSSYRLAGFAEDAAARASDQRTPKPRQPGLFDERPATSYPGLTASRSDPDWIDALLESEAFLAQRRLLGGGALDRNATRRLLGALSAGSGRLSQADLARTLRLSSSRIAGLLDVARRLLNVDQAQVLRVEGGAAVLDRVLLSSLFGLRSGSD